MFTKATNLFLCTVLVVMFEGLACVSFAGDETKTLSLSNALARVELFADLTDAERNALKDAAVLRHARSGERIIEQGKSLDRMFIILEGQAEVRVKGKRVTTFSGQSLVGEIEFLDRLPAAADVLLLKDSDIIELDCSALTSLMEKYPRMGYLLMGEIARIEARRLRATTQ